MKKKIFEKRQSFWDVTEISVRLYSSGHNKLGLILKLIDKTIAVGSAFLFGKLLQKKSNWS